MGETSFVFSIAWRQVMGANDGRTEARGAESQISTSRQHDGHHSSFDVFDDLDTPTCTLKGRSINTLNIKKGPPSAGGLSFLISKSKPLRTPFAPNSLH